ncbi:hypothetical protein ACFT9I_11370 [Streptomyces sp. NPDC057137]|uniref:hypothetical protein n=1 Tax=Streptomyces sp. NPDC057137 TaxID=3346030 RepID=UPI003626052B
MNASGAGEGGGSDRRTAGRPAGRARGGQASIDWDRWYPERPGYDEWARQWVQEMLDEGRIEELRSAARTGTSQARVRLMELYAEQGDIEEVRALVRTENKNRKLELLLTDTLTDALAGTTAGQDGLEAAVAVMKVRLDTLEKDAREELIELLRAQDRIEETIAFLQARPQETDYIGWHLLAHLLLLQGRIEDVRTMAADSTRRYARDLVTGVFVEKGRIEELRALGAHGFELSRALVVLGRVDDAIVVMQECLDANEPHAYDFLIKLLVKYGRVDQALATLESASRNPYDATSTASVEVARLLDEHGRAEDAIRILRTRGSGADEELAALLAAQGRIDEAVRVFDRAMADHDRRFVIGKLAGAQADLLIEYGRIDELRTRAETGHREYGIRLAAYLAEPDRTS